MRAILSTLVRRLDDLALQASGVIPWSCPIPVFGNIATSSIATLGINPSNREFVGARGQELEGSARRFQTLRSLGLQTWSAAEEGDLDRIEADCKLYFSRNPYDQWFRRLDALLTGLSASYYGVAANACHLDLIPYATTLKWTALGEPQKARLTKASGDSLAQLLIESRIELLILNGRSVVDGFEEVGHVRLTSRPMPGWTLPRKGGHGVAGIGFSGTIKEFAGVPLGRALVVLGFNHNLQSSFGVTGTAVGRIRDWIATSARGVAA